MTTRQDSMPKLVDGGMRRRIYLAPLYEVSAKGRKIIGERLTGTLPADDSSVAMYMRKGYRLATRDDIVRLNTLEGKMVIFPPVAQTFAPKLEILPRAEEQAGVEATKKTAATASEARASAQRQTNAPINPGS